MNTSLNSKPLLTIAGWICSQLNRGALTAPFGTVFLCLSKSFWWVYRLGGFGLPFPLLRSANPDFTPTTQYFAVLRGSLQNNKGDTLCL